MHSIEQECCNEARGATAKQRHEIREVGKLWTLVKGEPFVASWDKDDCQHSNGDDNDHKLKQARLDIEAIVEHTESHREPAREWRLVVVIMMDRFALGATQVDQKIRLVK